MRSTWLVLLVLSLGGVALADSNEDEADQLFQKGRALEKEGKTAEACDLYKQALDKNPNAVGTILNVALCDQKTGKVASAYKLFKDARARAKEQNLPEHQKAAEEHMAQLEDKIAHVALAFADPPTEDTRIVVANEVIEKDKTGDVLVDPGQVAIIVSRPGRVTYETKATIAEGEHKAIAIPALALPVTVKSGRRTFGKVLTFSGAGLGLVGLGLGVYAWRKYNDQFPSHCSKATHLCDPTGQAETESARTWGNVGTAVGIGGVVIAGVGAYLWFFGPHDERLAFMPQVDPEHAGIVALGRF